MTDNVDRAVEELALRRHGLIGRGSGMGNAPYAMEHDLLPREARTTIELILAGGPFPYPRDGTGFEDRLRDLPRGDYLEFTVPTPDVRGRG